MTKISAYPTLSNPTEDDILIGTDVNSSDETRNFSIGSIVNLVENGGRPYKSYTALLTQGGTSDPVATVLESSLDTDVIWTRESAGFFKASNASFSPLNTIGFVGGHNGSNIVIFDAVNVPDPNTVLVWQFQPLTDESVDNFEGQIEIRVYN